MGKPGQAGISNAHKEVAKKGLKTWSPFSNETLNKKNKNI